MTMEEIQEKAKAFAATRKALQQRVEEMNAEIEQLKNRRMLGIKRALVAMMSDHALLDQAIRLNPGLFEKPRSVVMHGIKVGFKKGAGGLEIADEAKTVALIEKLFPKAQAELLIKTTKKPIKGALNDLDVSELKRIGVKVNNTDDAVLIKPVDSDVEKLIKALMKDRDEDELEEAA